MTRSCAAGASSTTPNAKRLREITLGLDAAKARRAKSEHDFYVEGRLSAERYASLSSAQAAVIESQETDAKETAAEADLTVFRR